MKVGACILVHNLLDNDRVGLFLDCLESMREADAVYVVDNGSTDNTREVLIDARLEGVYTNTSGVTTCGQGTNLCARYLAHHTDSDLCVLSDDDMWWRPGWRDNLAAFSRLSRGDVWLTGCHLEPEFPWNPILDMNGKALIRASTGAASWSFWQDMWLDTDYLGGITIPTTTQGVYDVPFCGEIRKRGGQIAQIDLAEHRGTVSSWGNRTVELYGWDVEPVRARLA